MQALMRMRFGPYTFLQNPAQLQVENRALQQEERLLSGGVCVTPAGRRATVITGKGWWYGGRALEMAQVLRRLLLPGQAHWLFAPGAEPMRAYLTRFDYTCTTARDGVQYSFTFTEDCDPAPRYAPYGSTRVRGFAPDGACCFFGYADQQKLTVTPGQRRGFVYARSSACLLLDNEALPISLNAPNVDQMVHHYAAPFGFTAALPAGTAPGQYTVEKGTSCFGALQGFMQVLGAKGVFVDPENRLCVYGSEVPVTLPGDQITSITAVTERGEAPGVYAYKIASAEPYCRRLEAGYFADKKISRRRYVNVAAYPPEQRQQVLLRKLEQAAARYRRLEVVLTGAHRLPLYAPVVPKDGVPDGAGFRIFQREITGTARQVQTRLVLCCQPKLEAMYYVAE